MPKSNLQTRDDDEQEEKTVPTNVSGQRLKSFLERIERLEEEKKALAEDIRDVYSEAKSLGFEVKIMRKIVSLRKTNVEKRREEAELLELYMSAIGMAE
ncbi:MAG: DUF2312 domain-containing protein [Alphaproteobacteria bacterium]|jgi:uncharacterized protein (UPF0335 family)|nr:DUF2312 domain-containing protein [Alphaproteobacteria bacterium]